MVREIFTFVDSSQPISKIHLWNERDKAIAEGLEKFNNCIIEENKSKNINNSKKIKIADNQARFGCKGKNKHWYGYKRNVSVDMQSGLINKGAIFGDKGYCTKDSTTQMKIKNLHNCTIIALSKSTIWKIKTSIKINGSQKQDHHWADV